MAWQRLCFQNPSRVYSFGNPLRTFWQSFASRVLKNLARFFLLRRNFLPYIRGDSGNLLGFWPSGPKPCWGKNFISQVIDCQCEPFEILLNPKFNFRMNNSVFYGGSKFCPPFNWNPSVSAITLILLVSPNFKKLKSGFLSLIFWLWSLLGMNGLIIFHICPTVEDFITSFQKTMRQLSVDTCLVFNRWAIKQNTENRVLHRRRGVFTWLTRLNY